MTRVPTRSRWLHQYLNLLILGFCFRLGDCGGHTYLRQSLKDPKELERAKEYLERIVNGTGEFLKMPPILEPNTSPREFVDTEHGDNFYRVIMGLVLENYSKYKLTDPRTSGSNDCGANREVFIKAPFFLPRDLRLPDKTFCEF